MEFDTLTKAELHEIREIVDGVLPDVEPQVNCQVETADLFPITKGWLDKTLCKGANASLFVPDRRSQAIENEAKEVCQRCPVISDCLNDGYRNEPRTGMKGVRAGMSARQRKRIYSEMKTQEEMTQKT